MNKEYAICKLAAAPVRKEASHRSEMVNQLLFGETMELLETEGEWRRVRSLFDGYEGWLTHHLISRTEFTDTLPSPYIATGIINSVTSDSQLYSVPMGSFLTGFDEETRLLWNGDKYHGTYRHQSKGYNRELFLNTVRSWLNSPYLWGGKSFMGVDCSGFVQTVYKLFGINLSRDAWQQELQGEPVDSLQNAKEGDIAFFSNESGKIVHVGILLNSNEIIHAAGLVRIDRLTKEGIISSTDGRQTHNFHSLRRVIF